MFANYLLIVIDFFKDFVLAIILFLAITNFLMYQHEENIINQYGELFSNTGIVDTHLFNNLEAEMSKYRNLKVNLRLDDEIESGYYDSYFDNSQILDKPLDIGDFVYIEVVDQDVSMYRKVTNMFNGDMSVLLKRTVHQLTVPICKNYGD